MLRVRVPKEILERLIDSDVVTSDEVRSARASTRCYTPAGGKVCNPFGTLSLRWRVGESPLPGHASMHPQRQIIWQRPT